MPTITVDKDRFFRDVGKTFTEQEFDNMLFDYGLELDEDTSVTTPEEKPYKLKIEVPANRYDLLCHQGLVFSLRNYIGLTSPTSFKLSIPPASDQWTVFVRPDTTRIRPLLAAAILRGVKFDEDRYKDFIDLQDKLHGNLCRKRTLVAIGTHDLAKVDASKKVISYEARPPVDIQFAPLNQQTEFRADELMTRYESDKHLGKYLHIIRDSPVYPIIYDNKRTVLSMPPIINSDHTKITLDTRDIFIEATATDKTKLDIVINIMVTMFSQYCSEPFTVEPVKVVYEHELAITHLSPKLDPTVFAIRLSQINSMCGTQLSREDVCKCLERMGHFTTLGRNVEGQPAVNADYQNIKSAQDDDIITVHVPPTRPDVLHECDIAEDVAIAYGFNNIKRTFPSTNTVGKPYEINKLTDIVRRECAMAGWTEVLPLTLCSHDENFAFLNRKDDKSSAVVLSNPATFEYQVVRTSLLPGMLKTLRENRKHALPIRIFEASDVVLKHDGLERKARNERRLGAVYVGKKAGFEVVHGLLDRIMAMLDVQLEGSEVHVSPSRVARAKYCIKQSDDPTYFPGRSAKIFLRSVQQRDAKAPHATTLGHDTVSTGGPIAQLGSTASSHDHLQDQARGDQSSSGPLDTIKKSLASALSATMPSTSATTTTSETHFEIGSLGILHPDVLERFELTFPASAIELDLTRFL